MDSEDTDYSAIQIGQKITPQILTLNYLLIFKSSSLIYFTKPLVFYLYSHDFHSNPSII